MLAFAFVLDQKSRLEGELDWNLVGGGGSGSPLYNPGRTLCGRAATLFQRHALQ